MQTSILHTQKLFTFQLVYIVNITIQHWHKIQIGITIFLFLNSIFICDNHDMNNHEMNRIHKTTQQYNILYKINFKLIIIPCWLHPPKIQE